MKRETTITSATAPALSAVLELLKPITWFPPMWAFGCGVVCAGTPLLPRWPLILVGFLLTGPLVCGTSQAVNDWYDRHVDAINEPGRPIPSGRVPGEWGYYIAVGWTALSLAVAAALGSLVLIAAAFGLALAWAYSAPPFRLKKNGWWGNTAVAACYEGLPWLTGAAIMSGMLPDWRVFAVAALYSAGAHGIMTLNDFKSIEGDKRSGIRSLPVQLGASRAALFACCCYGGLASPGRAAIAVCGSAHLCRRDRAIACHTTVAHALAACRPARQGSLVQCDWRFALRARHARRGVCTTHIWRGPMSERALGWFGIARLGLVQAALGSIVVLTTSTMNRIMVVELALPAVVPGALVGLHYAVQLLRPVWGHGSDGGIRRRTPWIIGGMAALALGGFGAACATAWMASNRPAGLLLAVAAFALIGLGVGAAGTSLLALVASRADASKRAGAATVIWLMMIVGIVVTAITAGAKSRPLHAAKVDCRYGIDRAFGAATDDRCAMASGRKRGLPRLVGEPRLEFRSNVPSAMPSPTFGTRPRHAASRFSSSSRWWPTAPRI